MKKIKRADILAGVLFLMFLVFSFIVARLDYLSHWADESVSFPPTIYFCVIGAIMSFIASVIIFTIN